MTVLCFHAMIPLLKITTVRINSWAGIIQAISPITCYQTTYINVVVQTRRYNVGLRFCQINLKRDERKNEFNEPLNDWVWPEVT